MGEPHKGVFHAKIPGMIVKDGDHEWAPPFSVPLGGVSSPGGRIGALLQIFPKPCAKFQDSQFHVFSISTY